MNLSAFLVNSTKSFLMPLSTKKTTPSINYGKNTIDPAPEPPEEKTPAKEKTMPANEFLNLFGKVNSTEKKP